MSYVVCGIFLLIPLVFLWLFVTNVFDVLRKPICRRFGTKFRITKKQQIETNSHNGTQSVEDFHCVEVCVFNIWIEYESAASTLFMAEYFVDEIKKWRAMREQVKQTKKEVLKEEKL